MPEVMPEHLKRGFNKSREQAMWPSGGRVLGGGNSMNKSWNMLLPLTFSFFLSSSSSSFFWGG